jgi:beta-barrel assembly-enhancing protease
MSRFIIQTKSEYYRLLRAEDFEREADYVGFYIMALDGWPIDSAPDLWRRMAAESPGSITFASSHPTTAERFVRLEQWIDEIHKKQVAGEPLRPTMKK